MAGFPHSTTDLPVRYYKMKKKLPCKHVFAVVQELSGGCESLRSRFSTRPLFTLDNQVIGSTKTVEYKLNEYVDSCQSIFNNRPVNSKSTEVAKSKPVTLGLPCKKKNNRGEVYPRGEGPT